MTQFKRLLMDKNISNDEAASLFDVTVRTVSRWKNGEIKPSKLVIEKLESIESKVAV